MKATSSAVNGVPSAQVTPCADLDRVRRGICPLRALREPGLERVGQRVEQEERLVLEPDHAHRGVRVERVPRGRRTPLLAGRVERLVPRIRLDRRLGRAPVSASAVAAGVASELGAADGDAPPMSTLPRPGPRPRAGSAAAACTPSLVSSVLRAQRSHRDEPVGTVDQGRGTPPTVDWRMTSSVGRITRRGRPAGSSRSWRSEPAASAPCPRMLWRTVVSGGSRWAAKSRSSNPATATSSGTRRPRVPDRPRGPRARPGRWHRRWRRRRDRAAASRRPPRPPPCSRRRRSARRSAGRPAAAHSGSP